MDRRHLPSAAALSLLLLLAAPAGAQLPQSDPGAGREPQPASAGVPAPEDAASPDAPQEEGQPAEGEPPAQEAPPTLVLDVAFSESSGNTENLSFTASESLQLGRGGFRVLQNASLFYQEAFGQESAEAWIVGVRPELDVHRRVTLFGLYNFDRDEFMGIDQRHETGGGALLRLALGNPVLFHVFGALAYTQQEDLEGFENNYASGRAGLVFKVDLTERSYLQEALDYIPSFEEGDDYRVKSDSSLVVDLSRHFAVRVGYLVLYDNLPELGFEDTDRYFTAGLRLSL